MPDPQSTPPPKRKFAASWSADERKFIDFLIDAWNATVGKVGSRAYHVRPNHSAAVFFFRRIHPPNAGAPLFSHDAIRKALSIYAASEANIKLGSWKRFHDFFSAGEDMIDGLLRKAGIPAHADDARRAAAQKLAEHLGLVREARAAARDGETLPAHLAAQLRAAGRDGRAELREKLRAHYLHLSKTAFDLTRIELPAKRALHKRACDAFRAAFAREPNPQVFREDALVVHALAIALFDLQQRGLRRVDPEKKSAARASETSDLKSPAEATS